MQGIFSGEDVIKFQELVKRVPVSEDVIRYAVRLAASSRPKAANAPDFVKNWINWGAGTRAAQALVIGAKARVLWRGATHVTGDDIRALAAPVFRHRILLNYRAEADGVSIEQVIQKLIDALPKSV